MFVPECVLGSWKTLRTFLLYVVENLDHLGSKGLPWSITFLNGQSSMSYEDLLIHDFFISCLGQFRKTFFMDEVGHLKSF